MYFGSELMLYISMKRPDSWDDYCALNALTFFRGIKITKKIIFVESFHTGKKCKWISGHDKSS